MAIRTLPDNQFTYGKRLDLRPGPFHTYAVEVTQSHVSWFVDTHVRDDRAARPRPCRARCTPCRFRLDAGRAPG